MDIRYHENERIFHLYNDSCSLVLFVADNGQLGSLYYGRHLRDENDFAQYVIREGREGTTVSVPEPGIFSADLYCAEYPAYGTGDYRTPAIEVQDLTTGSYLSDYKYQSYRIYDGKEPLEGLPATYVEAPEEARTLVVTLVDEVLSSTLELHYTIYRDLPVITRHARIVNNLEAEGAISIHRAMSVSHDYPEHEYEMLQFSGAWGRERHVKTRRLEYGMQGIQGTDGTCGGNEQNPFLVLKRPETTEFTGDAYGFSLVYSGNFLATVDVGSFGSARVMMGIHPMNFEWRLEPGEAFTTPEAVMVYSKDGLNGMSQVYHQLYRNRLQRGAWRNRPRPVLLNNWEATFMDFDEASILRIASKAQEAGVELFVLDDGWFGARNDDHAGLGDWVTNLDKLPSDISGLSEQIEAMGMRFGLWVELEMVNKDSDLYRAHPDWIISAPGRFESTGRHQCVLDYTRQEVRDYIYESITKVLDKARISYIKWDMNRYMSEPFGKAIPPERQGEFMHRYILGVYDLYERMISRYPDVLFESCASGGKRFDPGMLYYAPQAWTSDDTDANERVRIQYGTSYAYPLISMGAHVSAVPNGQLQRVTPIYTRGVVSFYGTGGYELDLNRLSDEEMEEVKRQICFLKQYRELIQVDGTFYRLLSPFEGNTAGWICVSSDKGQALAMYYQTLNQVNASFLYYRLQGLDPNVRYHVSWRAGEERKETISYGDALMQAGIPVSRADLNAQGGDFAAILYVLERIPD